MARLVTLTPNKTYASEANAIKAVEKKYPDGSCAEFDNLRYFLQRTEDGRFFPVFVGQSALQAMVHFNFNVLM